MTEYTPEQILKMIEDHGGPEGLDLSGKDLSGINLGRGWIQEEMGRRGLSADNPPVWFSPDTGGINLQHTDLDGANLQNANLVGANLQNAPLQEANLQNANLVSANLQGAHLEVANLQNAQLQEANLQGAQLAGANLQGAHLEGANLQNAQLRGANLQGTQLWWANLQNAWLQGANLEQANLTGAGLEGAYFYGARLEGAYFYGARLRDTRLELPAFIGEEKKGWGEAAREAYIALKVNLRNLGHYDQARKAFIREMRMERHTHFLTQAGNHAIDKVLEALPQGHWKRRLGRLYRGWLWARLFLGLKVDEGEIRLNRLSYLGNLLMDKVFYYFESPGRVLLYLLAAPALFALLYWLGGGLTYIEDGKSLPPLWWEYIIFSLRTLPTLAFNDLQPVGAGRWLSAVEGVLGVSLFAMFVYSLGRRTAGY